MNIVIQMVGEGRRFKEQGFSTPKPLILVMGKCIVQHAIDSLGVDGKYIFEGKETSYSVRTSFVWTLVNGEWKKMHSHWSPRKGAIGIPTKDR